MTEGGNLPVYANETALLSLQGSVCILQWPPENFPALPQHKMTVKEGDQDEAE